MSKATFTTDAGAVTDPPTPKRRPDGRKARTNAALIDAAGRLFAEQGFARTTVEEIAAAANVSVGSLYVHFGSKERLQLVLVNRAMDLNDEYIDAARQAASPIERVLNVGDAYLRFALEHPFAFRFVAMRPVEPGQDDAVAEISAHIAERVQRIILAIASDLREAMDQGEIDPVPIDDGMTFLFGAWNGVAGLMFRQDALVVDAEAAKRSLELAKRVLLAGLRPAGS